MIPSPTTVGLISTVLAFVSAVLYLVAYWGSFSLNVFEFVSMESLVRAAIYPLFFIAAAVVGHLLFYGPLVFRSDVAPPPRLVVRDAIATDATETGGMTPAARLRIWLIVVIVFVTWAAYVGIFGEWEQIPYVLAVLLAIALAKHLVSSSILSAEVPHPLARLIVVSVLLSIPALSFAHGVARANSLIFRRGDFVYVCESQLRKPEKSQIEHELRFVGKAGDFFFFVQDPEIAALRVLKYDDFSLLRFNRSVATDRGLIAWLVARRFGDTPKASPPPRRKLCGIFP